MKSPLIANQKAALALGIGLTLAGSFVLRDAYERRGKRSPWLLRWLPNA